MKKRLVTSALPYVNNIPHLGNLTQVLSADVFARFCRLKGYETLYICGTDEYGTATETRALKEGISPRELCDRYHAIHRDIYEWFNIGFDYFGRTSTEAQTEIVQDIFNRMDKAGYVNEHEMEQLYCPKCERFLADRFVEGTCPHCHAEGARGDQCDNCQTLLDPIELIDPHCVVCGTTPVVKKTKHLYIDLPKALPLLESWMEKASKEGFWANNAIQVTKSWIRDGLKERCITRDLKWGIPVPKPGYEKKVFYVWFDAPIGYVSISANATKDWKKWWFDPDNTELFQFIGKDNIPFHTVIFPSCQLASGLDWTMLHHMSSTEYLNYEGGKFSKSLGIGIFGNDVQDTGIPADVWRFYMFYNRPEKSDVTFTWADFQEKVNGELIGNLSNLVNRTLTFVKRFYEDEALFDAPIDSDLHAQIVEREKKIDSFMERAEERDALRQIISLSSLGNKAFQAGEPWKMHKEQPEKAMSLLKTLVYLIRDLAVMVQPFMPETSLKMLSFLHAENTNWNDLGNWEGVRGIGDVSLLFTKLEDSLIEQLRTRFSGSQEEREQKKTKELEKTMDQKEDQVSLAEQFASRVVLKVAKITNVEKHPRGDKLYILTLDVKEEEPRTIISSIVPYYKEEELQDQNIVLVSNLKPANFRGEKSYGMLLAASDPDAEEHTTCEVLFAPQFEVGSVLTPEGFSPVEEKLPYIKADHFFSMPIYTESGVVKIDGKPIGKDGVALTAKKYLNGPVG
ncbi:methionine--tRNA ligase [Sphaerochaeta halotolerans]|uniref:methionine--tRNA ligase n=1 Tax=Sphaerochaeta halotolerans TaxID=2293840 RepID=UPI001369461F|nr:methionine--tRNA ligase [Sphaerochaeta halotolerans]MXI87432.1 methionine--tRNA ligase [Sphaerochaeta halotolerans]